MLINLRNALMAGKRFPYDAEVEYLESTGTQWIDTGVIPNGVKSTIDFALTQVKSGQIAGCHNPNNQRYYPLEVSGTPLQFKRVDRFDNGSYVGTADTNRHTSIYYYDGNKASFDGTESQGNQYAISSAIYNCILFGTTAGGVFSTDNAIPMKVFGCKMEKDGVVLRDFIPVRKGTLGYLYDRATGRLFGNDGTGDFVLGPDVVPVEYIESHGTERIDTGILPSNDMEFSCVAMVTRIRSGFTYSNITGSRTSSSSADQFSFTVSSNWAGEPRFEGNYCGWGAYEVRYGSDHEFDNQWHTWDYSSAGISVDGVRKATFPGTVITPTTGMTIWLFARRGPNAALQNPLVGMIKKATYKVNGVPLRSFRPVRVGSGSTWEGAMMDVLTRRIYRNAGTGAFTYGNDLKYPIPAE